VIILELKPGDLLASFLDFVIKDNEKNLALDFFLKGALES